MPSVRCLKKENRVQNGVIVHSDLLLDYLKRQYPGLYFVSSTTKSLQIFSSSAERRNGKSSAMLCRISRLNKSFAELDTLPQDQKDKVEFLCNECCWYGCRDRKHCYENVSRKNLGEDCPDHRCTAPGAQQGYRFSKAMENPGFIGAGDIRKIYLPGGFSNFKIEGAGTGQRVDTGISALLHDKA